MAGLKRLVGVTLAVVLVTALVVYVLRPAATPTKTSTVTEPGTPTIQPPPIDQGTCPDQGHGDHRDNCDASNGTGHDSDRDNDADDHNSSGGHSDDDSETNDHNGHDWESDRNEAGHDDNGEDGHDEP